MVIGACTEDTIKSGGAYEIFIDEVLERELQETRGGVRAACINALACFSDLELLDNFLQRTPDGLLVNSGAPPETTEIIWREELNFSVEKPYN